MQEKLYSAVLINTALVHHKCLNAASEVYRLIKTEPNKLSHASGMAMLCGLLVSTSKLIFTVINNKKQQVLTIIIAN